MNLDAIVVSNIRYLLSQKGMRIGDFEKHLNLCVGYFSRHENEEVDKKKKDRGSISLALAYRISQEFGISIDELCSDIRLKELQKTAKEYGFKLVPEDDKEV